jgi:hypothetical protein
MTNENGKDFHISQGLCPRRHHQGKFCATCGDLATVEALFDVGNGVTLIEITVNYVQKK